MTIYKALHNVGRKNCLFAGSHEAAQRSAMLYLLPGTRKLHDINPFIRLKDLLEHIANYPITKDMICCRRTVLTMTDTYE